LGPEQPIGAPGHPSLQRRAQRVPRGIPEISEVPCRECTGGSPGCHSLHSTAWMLQAGFHSQVSQPVFHSQASADIVPHAGFQSKDSTAKIPQPRFHRQDSTCRIPKPGIPSQDSKSRISQP